MGQAHSELLGRATLAVGLIAFRAVAKEMVRAELGTMSREASSPATGRPELCSWRPAFSVFRSPVRAGKGLQTRTGRGPRER